MLEQRIILVGILKDDNFNEEDRIREMRGLVEAAGGRIVGEVFQQRLKPDPASYLGRGKVEEVRMMADALEADLIVVDDELSPSTTHQLAKVIERPIVDRTTLILDIFALRSRTSLSKAQVELAQLRYHRSHLAGIGLHLSQQGGGIGTRGPGETQLETDRRKIDRRITELKARIHRHQSVLKTQRKKRQNRPEKIVALIGYTNAGKSSLMNWFLKHYDASGHKVFEKNMLFATLDTFVRRIELDDGYRFLMIDTVGFVHRLPHSLIESFKATLEEVLQADLLLHVLDSNDENVLLQQQATHQVLLEIGAENIPRINLMNKWDLPGKHSIDESFICVSSRTGEGMEKLVQEIRRQLFSDLQESLFFFPFHRGRAMDHLLRECKLLQKKYNEHGVRLLVLANARQRNQFKEFFIDSTEPTQ